MPTSWYQTIPDILNHLTKEQPSTILDIGVGFGKYGVLAREVLELPYQRYNKEQWKVNIHGIEAFEDYTNPIYGHVYNQIFYGNVLDIIDNLEKYDMILLIDVLEHFTKEEGLILLKKLITHTKGCLIVSTPIYPSKQEEYLGNSYEEHKSRWFITDFSDFSFSYQEVQIGDNGAHIFKLYPKKQIENYPADKDLLKKSNIEISRKPMTITYVLPHKKLTGGLKMLLQHMAELKKRGHILQAVLKSDNDEKAIPDWMELEVDREIIVPFKDELISYIDNSDVIVAGWIGQLSELSNSTIPVFYWEQGHEWLFGDIPNYLAVDSIRSHLQDNYSQNVAIASVSPFVGAFLKSNFGRESIILPNFIDTDFYCPTHKVKNGNNIILVGNPQLRFKGFSVALKALELVWNAGYQFNVTFVTQQESVINNCPFPVQYHVNPSQETLAELYREADIHLFTSWYEGFSMPPLEAMASGTAVVATKNGGIEVYAKHGVNAFLADPGDYEGLAVGVLYFLKNKSHREDYGKRGRETALQFSYSKGIHYIEECLFKLIN